MNAFVTAGIVKGDNLVSKEHQVIAGALKEW